MRTASYGRRLEDVEHPSKRTTAGPTRALVAASLVVLVVLLALSVAPRAAAAVEGPGGEGSAPAGVWPLAPGPDEVVHGFDPPSCPWCAGERGVDLAGSVGQAVRAALGGRVTYAGPLAGRDVVVVDAGGVRTEYEPVAPSVRRGDVVATGGLVGRLAVIGSHCFPAACLHLGLIRDSDDAYLDPLSLFPAAPVPVRLLPLGAAPRVAPRSAAGLPRSTWTAAVVAAQALGWASW